MATKTKFVRVAVEGATASDGRTIEKSWISDMAATYNPLTYTARVNLEHVRGVTGQSPFKALGDVLALKAEPVVLSIAGKDETRLALYAQLDPTADLLALNKDRQKIFTSIEVAPNFANTGRAGLVGLAVTDTPASLGTEALKFSTGEGAFAAEIKATLDGRKTNPANFFSAALETKVELEAEPAAADDKVSLSALVAAFSGLFAPKAKEPSVAPPATAEAPNAFDQAAFAAALTRFGEGLQASTAAAIDAAVKPVRDELTTFKTKVELADADPNRRPPATGSTGTHAAIDY